MNLINEICVLVISCDKYADLWLPFFTLFWKNWPSCPYPVYLGTNKLTYSDYRVNTILIGKDRGWATNVLNMLDSLEYSYVLTFLEDFFLQKSVNSETINRLVRIAMERELGCLRLGDANLYNSIRGPAHVKRNNKIITSAPSIKIPDYSNLGIITQGTPYRVSTQVSIWKVSTLRRLLLPRFNIWEFEEIGTQLSERLQDQFWSIIEPVFIYENAIEKGKWKSDALLMCREEDIEVDLQTRSVFSKEELHEHFLKVESHTQIINIKRWALKYFFRGQRSKGLRCCLSYLKHRPASIQIWIIMLFGLLGPKFLLWIKTAHLSRKIAKYHRFLL